MTNSQTEPTDISFNKLKHNVHGFTHQGYPTRNKILQTNSRSQPSHLPFTSGNGEPSTTQVSTCGCFLLRICGTVVRMWLNQGERGEISWRLIGMHETTNSSRRQHSSSGSAEEGSVHTMYPPSSNPNCRLVMLVAVERATALVLKLPPRIDGENACPRGWGWP